MIVTALMGLITLGLLVWFGMKAFSDDSPGSGSPNNGGGGGGGQASAASNATAAGSNTSAAEANANDSASEKTSASSGGTAAVAAGAAAVASGAAIASAGSGVSGHASGVADALASGDADSVREMMKVLNLRESDAARLGIDKTQFANLWQGKSDGIDSDTLTSVTSRLKNMMS